MMEQTHLTSDDLAAFWAGDMTTADANHVKEHLDACEACSARLADLQAFVADLDDAWNRDRLKAMGMAHPSAAQIEALWLEDANAEDLAAVRQHVKECDICREYLEGLEQGFAALSREDPLGSPAWSDVLRQRFAAGIEMAVEAANGAYTTAAGLARDVMTPQSRARLNPATVVAMGGEGPRREKGALWHDATFETDELSGEITGSTDSHTGRGIITVTINKSGGYVAVPPIVDLVNEKGGTVATQVMLDLGDRYSTHFVNLDEGRYLVGVREPGD